MKEDTNNVNVVEDVTLLLVSGSKGKKEDDKQYVKKLSNAILQVFYKHNSVKLRCVGAAAINNAIKSYIIADGEAQKRGDNFRIKPSFTTVRFKDEQKTGILFEVSSLNK